MGQKIKLKPIDVSIILDKTLDFVYAGLREGVFDFGYGVKMPGGKYSYHISEHKLRDYIGSEEMDRYLKNKEEGQE